MCLAAVLYKVWTPTYCAINFMVLCPCEYPPHSWCTPSTGMPGAHIHFAWKAKALRVDVFSVRGCIYLEDLIQLPAVFRHLETPFLPLGLL